MQTNVIAIFIARSGSLGMYMSTCLRNQWRVDDFQMGISIAWGTIPGVSTIPFSKEKC
jgi:hypothetical protein